MLVVGAPVGSEVQPLVLPPVPSERMVTGLFHLGVLLLLFLFFW